MADQTPGTLELNCPGCGAYFRLKPKKGRLPEGPIPCPKCRTPIPVVAQRVEEPKLVEAPPSPVNRTQLGGISGVGASEDRVPKRRAEDDSLPGFGGPLNPLAAMLQDDGVGPNSTFLGFQKLPFAEGSTRVINPDEMVPDAEIKPDNSFSKDKRGSTTDTSRFLKEEMPADRGDEPIAPHLRNTRENIAVSDQLPDLFDEDEEDSLGEMLSQARLGPEGDLVGDGTRMEEAEAGPFDLRDILEAEKHRVGETNSQSVTRNPLLEKGNVIPEPEPEKPRDNPWARSTSQTLDELMGEVDASKRQSGMLKAVGGAGRGADKGSAEREKADGPPVQLAKLKLGLRRAKEAEVRETSERSSSAAFGRAVSSNDVFSESSSVAHDDQATSVAPAAALQAAMIKPTAEAKASRLASASGTFDDLPVFGDKAAPPAEEERPLSGKRTMPLTPVMPAPAVMPTGALPESEQAGAPPAQAAPSEAPKKEKSPPLAALLKKKINTDKLKALGEGGGLGESSSAASADDAVPAPAPVERPAADAPGFETSIAEVLRRAEAELARQPETQELEADPAATVEVEVKIEEPAPVAPEAPQASEAPHEGRVPGRQPEAFKTAPMRHQRVDDDAQRRPTLPNLGDAPSKPSLSLPTPDPMRASGALGALKRRAAAADKSSEELEAGVAPAAAVKTTAPHRPLPSISTSEQPSLQIPASLAGLPNLTSSEPRKPRTRQSTEPMFPVAPSGLLSIQPPQPSAQSGAGLGNEPSAAGMAGERRGSGYIRLPTSEILEVLGQGSYRIMVEDIVYEPVDEQGLTELIKRGVLLGAEQIAEADGDWMPIGEHPVFRRLRRRMAMEAHALLAKYRKASEEKIKREREAQEAAEEEDRLLDLLDDDSEESSPQTAGEAAPPMFLTPSPADSGESDEELDLWGDSKVMEESAPERPALALEPGSEQPDAPAMEPARDTAVIEFPSHIDSSGSMRRVEPEPEELPSLRASQQDVIEEEAAQEPEPVEPEPVVAAVEPEAAKPEPVRPEPAKPEVAKPRPSAEPARPALREEEPVKPSSRSGLVLALVGLLLVGLVAAVMLVPSLREAVLGSGGEPAPAQTPDAGVAQAPTPADPAVAPAQPTAEADMGAAAAANNAAQPPTQPTPQPAVAGGELAARWAKAPADGQLALKLVAEQQAAGQHTAARRTILSALAAGATEREALESKFKESLSAPDLEPAPMKRLVVGEVADGALAQRLYGRVAVELRKGGEPVAMFFPDVLDEPGNWRSQLAAARLCEVLGCPLELPQIEPVFVTDADLRKLKGAVSERQADTDELDWSGEKVEGVEGRADVLRGVMIRWSAKQAAWPTEAANVWRPWLDPATDMAELGAPLKDALGGLERYQGGIWFEPGKAAAAEASVKEFARGVAGMLLLDYLIGNWERYARPDQGINAAIEGGALVALYQGTAFPARTSSRVKGRFDYFGRYDAAMVEGLRLISPEALDEVLFPQPSGAERAGLRVFWERRDEAIKRIEAQIKRHGAERVLFGVP